MSNGYEYDLSIIVVAWNVKELLDECFAALRGSDDRLRKQILLVDNGSADGSAEFVMDKYPEVELIRSPTNLGFIRANNLAYTRARGEYILMLNSDAFVSPTALRETVSFMRATPEAGAVGARLLSRDGTLQPSARFFPLPSKIFLAKLGLDGKIPFIGPMDDLEWDHRTVRKCDWVVGCYLLSRKELIDRTGFFLREDFFMYNDDNDLCKRLQRIGYKTYFYPVDVVHVGGANIKKMHKNVTVDAQVLEYQLESQMIYFRKNYWIGMAISSVLFNFLFDLLLLVKRAFLLRFDSIRKDLIPHMKLVASVARRTGYGSRPIR
jgi:N-acetylglucosaminyl-diphospho-decaprenol L-rhamnosyltransferase